MNKDDVILYMSEHGFTLNSRNSDYTSMSFMTDPISDDYTIHANVNHPYDRVELCAIIGFYKLSTGSISLPHPKIDWYIESLQSCATYGEHGRILHRDKIRSQINATVR